MANSTIAARSSSMVSKVLTHRRFSFKVRMKRSATPLPSGSRTKEGEAWIPRHLISSWKSPGHVVGAVIVTQFQSTRRPGRDGSEALVHPLTHQLQRLEAIGRPRHMNADNFRIGVLHGDSIRSSKRLCSVNRVLSSMWRSLEDAAPNGNSVCPYGITAARGSRGLGARQCGRRHGALERATGVRPNGNPPYCWRFDRLDDIRPRT